MFDIDPEVRLNAREQATVAAATRIRSLLDEGDAIKARVTQEQTDMRIEVLEAFNKSMQPALALVNYDSVLPPAEEAAGFLKRKRAQKDRAEMISHNENDLRRGRISAAAVGWLGDVAVVTEFSKYYVRVSQNYDPVLKLYRNPSDGEADVQLRSSQGVLEASVMTTSNAAQLKSYAEQLAEVDWQKCIPQAGYALRVAYHRGGEYVSWFEDQAANSYELQRDEMFSGDFLSGTRPNVETITAI